MHPAFLQQIIPGLAQGPFDFKILQLFTIAGCAHFTKGPSSVVAFAHSLRLKELEQILASQGPNFSPTARAEG